MPQGLQTSYDLTVGVKVNIEDLIYQLNPADVPLQGIGSDGRATIATGTCFEKKVEWLDDTILTPKSTLNGAITTGTTAVVIATVDANHFGVGDVLLIESEYMRVTALSTDGVTLTVTRAFAGTAVNHADTTLVTGVGKALPEGSDPSIARATDRSNRFNYTQIFGPEKVQVSGTENVVQKYGISMSEFDYQAGQRTKEAYIAIEQAILYGSRVEDTTNKWRTLGGLAFFLTTNVDSSTTTLTDSALLTQIQAAYDAGGRPTNILVGSKQKRAISGFESSILRRAADASGRGQSVDTFLSDFGELTVTLDRWVRKNDLFGYDRDMVELDTLRPMQFQMLAKTGDAEVGQIVAEKSLIVRRERHGFRFSALT